MKKIVSLLSAFLVSLAFAMNVEAASGHIGISANTSLAVVGSTFTVSVQATSSESLGAWNFGISYDSSQVAYVGGDQMTIADYAASDGQKASKIYKYTFKALKSGVASIRISGASMVSWNDTNTLFTPTTGATSVTIKTQAEIQASYSKDNSLKSLTVEGYELSPTFNKDTLEYSVSVSDTVEQIKVSAQVSEAHARVTGTGSIDISEGANKISIVVTAQNGSTKTYTLNVDVKDLKPINVSVGSTNYTVVKKQALLSAPTGFTEATLKIQDEEVPVFKSARAGLTLVGLKDSEGKIALFLYNESDNSYSVYNELKNSAFTILPTETVSVPEGFKKDKMTINGIEVEVMKATDVDGLVIIYGTNVETGDKDYYAYDEKTHAFMKYDGTLYESLLKEKDTKDLYFTIACGVSIAFASLILLVIVMFVRISKLKSLLMKFSKKENNHHEKKDAEDDEKKLFKEEEERS